MIFVLDVDLASSDDYGCAEEGNENDDLGEATFDNQH